MWCKLTSEQHDMVYTESLAMAMATAMSPPSWATSMVIGVCTVKHAVRLRLPDIVS
jgi:hypothetical protein